MALTISAKLPPTLEQATARIAEIEKELSKLDTLVQERLKWKTYKDALLQVTNPAPDPAPVGASGAKQPQRIFPLEHGIPLPLTTVGYAEQALKTKGSKMHLDEMLVAVRKSGWKGTGNDRIDRDRLYSAMHRQRHKFQPAGTLTWKLITQ